MSIKPWQTVVIVAVVAVLVLAIGLLSSSLKRLSTYEVGLKYDTIWKSLGDSPESAGLHSGPPGFEFIVFPNVFRTLDFEDLVCLNKDGVSIELDVSYQYKARVSSLRNIIMQFKDHDVYKEVLHSAGESALHEACSMYNTSQFQAERGAFQESVRLMLLTKYDELECDVTEVQVNDIRRPRAYETAIKDKEAARENIKVAENERPRKLTKAETVKLQTETQAKINVEKAMSEARMLVNRAETIAKATIDQYKKEADTYAKLMSTNGLNLDAEGFLSYIGVRVVADAKNPIYVGLKTPAKTSYAPP